MPTGRGGLDTDDINTFAYLISSCVVALLCLRLVGLSGVSEIWVARDKVSVG